MIDPARRRHHPEVGPPRAHAREHRHLRLRPHRRTDGPRRHPRYRDLVVLRSSRPGHGHLAQQPGRVRGLDGPWAGYYLADSDGGIFTFGDTRFHGSVPGIAKHVHNIVGMVVNGSAGHMLVGSDGGVFNFGQSHFYGSLPGQGIHVNNIRGILPSSEDTGYVLVGADGGVFNFGTGVNFYGSLPGIGVKVNNIVGIALTPDDGGYFMAGQTAMSMALAMPTPYATPDQLHANLPVAAIAGT